MKKKPFRDEDVLYRFVPTEKDKGIRLHPIDEYAIVRSQTTQLGFSVWELYEGRWQYAAGGDRVLIAHLLADLQAMTSERDLYWGQLKQSRKACRLWETECETHLSMLEKIQAVIAELRIIGVATRKAMEEQP